MRDNGVSSSDLVNIYTAPEDGDPEKKSNNSSPTEILNDIKTSISSIGNFNIFNAIGEYAMNIFSIKKNITTTDGDEYSKYIARNWENSGPDYMSVDFGYSTYPILLHEGNLSLGYVKGDGIFLLNSWGLGTGLDISASIGISIGRYNGDGKPNAQSLSGLNYKISGGIFKVGGSFSQDITYSQGRHAYIGKNWSIGSFTFGPGISPVSGSAALTYTLSPLYIYKFKQ
jgi:hypothetical protein